MQAKYKNKDNHGLIKGHEYVIEIDKPTGCYVYNLHVIFDITKQEDTDIVINYGSMISLKKSWDSKELRIDNE